MGLVLLAALAFVNALQGEFLYDDFAYVVNNPQAQQPSFARICLEPLAGRPELGLYRPLPLATYGWQAGGRGAEAPTWPFHALNVALHAIVSVLVWRLALRIGLEGIAAWLAAALFAVHPAHLEAVNWIVGRAELLAAVFGLGFLLVALRTPRRPRDTWLAALLLLGAGLSKESAFTLPAVLVTLEWATGRTRRWRDWVARHWPWLLVLGLLAALRFAVMGRFAPAIGLAPYRGVAWWQQGLLSTQLLGGYAWRAIVPTASRIFFHQCEFLEAAPTAIVGAAAWITALLLLWRRPPLRAALLAFPVALLTVLNLWPIQETFAERFLYLPSAFLLMAAAKALAAVVTRERVARGRIGLSIAVPGVVVATLLGFTWSSNSIFDGALPLWRHNVALAPDLPYVHYQFAYFLHDHDLFLRRDVETPGAIEEYELALAKNAEMVQRGYDGMPPDQLARSWTSLGSIWLTRLSAARADPRKAKVALEKAIEVGEQFQELNPELVRALCLYAQLRWFDVGVDRAMAERALRHALEIERSEEQRVQSLMQQGQPWRHTLELDQSLERRKSIEDELQRLAAESTPPATSGH